MRGGLGRDRWCHKFTGGLAHLRALVSRPLDVLLLLERLYCGEAVGLYLSRWIDRARGRGWSVEEGRSAGLSKPWRGLDGNVNGAVGNAAAHTNGQKQRVPASETRCWSWSLESEQHQHERRKKGRFVGGPRFAGGRVERLTARNSRDCSW